MGLDILQLHRGPVYPPSNGEEVRIWETTKALADTGRVWLAYPDADGAEFPPGVYALDLDNPFLDYKATRIYLWNALLGLGSDTPIERLQTRLTVRTVRRRPVDFDVVCSESPQVLGAARLLADHYDAALLLNKHNAMFDLLDQQLRSRSIPGPIRRRAVDNLRAHEQAGIDDADAVVFQSAADREAFDVPDGVRCEVVTNGTNYDDIAAGGDPEAVRRRLGVGDDRTVCLFVGACDYEPNEEAARRIVDEYAPALSDVEFVIVGRDPPKTTRENVYTPGFVDDLPGALAMADIALCPLTMGSGTKLKMMDYLAAGLPIVTTPVGAQGIDIVDGETALVRDVSEFEAAIRELSSSPELAARLSANARALGRQYSWDELLSAYDDLVTDIAGRRVAVD
ncbi:glycosyltransferase family 4 protein [Haloprofundus halophilus]|uniref:glycosyltransferase family 4 protein n=1 Tax=Haloprofundus halophilus TaxID=2283527 RepID=UPI000E4443E4|nr:glycosyltransferase family 4 protein [Haloprofundus halophilus]